jgi:hypothetical protein
MTSTHASALWLNHCFVLLGVSPNQLKHYRVRTEQCYLISGFRLRSMRGSLC